MDLSQKTRKPSSSIGIHGHRFLASLWRLAGGTGQAPAKISPPLMEQRKALTSRETI
ncbi:hypothetical protein [Hallella colorans]|uniref:hypothetical protein n=1 Tax=Hallella colorans TaxID=1703337 RepID=UPI00248E4F51|nr:hypothetical protein [Hallella colorans]